MDATLRVVVLGNDAIAAAAPATPVQLMHACRAAGFGLVVPPNWGDELVAMEALRQLDGLGRQPAVLVACPHVAARVEGVPGGPDLALVAIVAPPVAAARHLRRLAGDTRLHLTYVGGCPDAARPDSDIDQRMLPDEFIAALAARGIVPAEQPTLFEDVLPPDRRRWVSLPGGVPMPAAVARRGGHSLVELDGVHAEAAARWRSLVRGSGLVDAAAGLGCACSGALPGRGGTSARARVVSADPPRAKTAVVAELPGLNLERRVTLQRAAPRASPPRSVPAIEEQPPAPRPQREPDPAPPPRPDPRAEPEPETPPPQPEQAPEIDPPPVVPSEVDPPRTDPPSGDPPMHAFEAYVPEARAPEARAPEPRAPEPRASDAYVLYAPAAPIPEPVPAMTLLVEAERDAAFAQAALDRAATALARESSAPADEPDASPESPDPAARPLLAFPKPVFHTPVRVPTIGEARDVARAWLERPPSRIVQLAVMAATIAGIALLARWTRPRDEGARATVPAASALMDTTGASGAARDARVPPATVPGTTSPVTPRATRRATPPAPAPSTAAPTRRTTRSAPGTVTRSPSVPTPRDTAPAAAAPATPIVTPPAPRETTVARPAPRPAAADTANAEREAIRRELEQRRARLDSIQRRVDSLYRTRRPPR